jgi:hypothetical protein
MKLKCIFAAFFLLASFAVRSQTISNPNPGLYGISYNRGEFPNTLWLPTGCGVPVGKASLNSTAINNPQLSALFADTCGHHIYWYHANDSSWSRIDTGGGGGGSGTVTGVLISNDSLYYSTSSGNTFVALLITQADSTVKYVTPSQLNANILTVSNDQSDPTADTLLYWASGNTVARRIQDTSTDGSVTITKSYSTPGTIVYNLHAASGQQAPNIGNGPINIYSPQVPGYKTITAFNGVKADTTTHTNQITIQVDTSRMIHVTKLSIRGRVPDYALEQIYLDDSLQAGVFYNSADPSALDDSVMTFVSVSGTRWKRLIQNPGHVNIQWFVGASSYTDATYPGQKAIIWCINNPTVAQTVDLPVGTYVISSPWIIAQKNTGGTDYNQVSVNLTGVSNQLDQSAGVVSIIYTGSQDFAIGIQKGKTCLLKNLQIQGVYTYASTFPEINVDTLLPAAWWDGVVRNNTVSPLCLIAIDPFCDSTTMTGSGNVYPGLGSYYITGMARSGSTGITIEGCHLFNSWVDIMITPCYQQDGEIIHVNDVQFGTSYCGLAEGQAQSKEVDIIHPMCWGSMHTLFDNVHFGYRLGDGGGNIFVERGNFAGQIYQLFDISTNSFRSYMDNCYAESVFKIGNALGPAGVNFIGDDFNFATADAPTIPYPDYFLSGDNVTVQDCEMRLYGLTTIPLMYTRLNGKFIGGTTNLPPIIANLNPGTNADKPRFEDVNLYYGTGILGNSVQSAFTQYAPTYEAFGDPVYPGIRKITNDGTGVEYTFTYDNDWERLKSLGNYLVRVNKATNTGKFYAGSTLFHFIQPGDVILTTGLTSRMEGTVLPTNVVGIVDSISRTTDTCYLYYIGTNIKDSTTYTLTDRYTMQKGDQFAGNLVSGDNKLTTVRVQNGLTVAGAFPVGSRQDVLGLIPGAYVDSVKTDTVYYSYAFQSGDSVISGRIYSMNGSPDIKMKSPKTPEHEQTLGNMVYAHASFFYEPKSYSAPSFSQTQTLSQGQGESYWITNPFYPSDSYDSVRYNILSSGSRGQSLSLGTTSQFLTTDAITKAELQVNTDTTGTNGVPHPDVFIPGYGQHVLAYYDELPVVPSPLNGTGYVKMSGLTASYRTNAQLTSDVNVFTTSTSGAVPASGTVSGQYLTDGGWIPAPSGLTTLYSGDATLTLDGSGWRVVNSNNGSYHWDSLQNWRMNGGTGKPQVNLNLTGSSIAFTSSTSTPYSFDQNLTTAGVLVSTGTVGANHFTNKTYIGNAVGTGDLNVQSAINTYTQFVVEDAGTTGYAWIALKDNSANEHLRMIYYGSAAGGAVGTALANSTNFLGSVLGNMNYGSTGSTDTTNFYVGGSAYTNRVMSFIPDGNVLIHQNVNADSTALLQIGAGTTSDAQLFLASSVDPTTLRTGQAWFVKGASATQDSLNFQHNGVTTNLLAPGPSGSFTCTPSNTLNVSAATVTDAYYTQSNQIVTVTVSGSVTTTTALLSSTITITLPISTTQTGLHTYGSCAVDFSGGSPSVSSAGVVQLASSTTVVLDFPAPSTAGNSVFTTTFQYHL